MTSTGTALGTRLRSLIDALDGDVERAYADAGLDFRPRFTPVIRALAAEGPLCIKDLAVRVGLSHSALSQTVGQLVARGWIRLEAGEDGRQRIAALTAQGVADLPKLEPIWAATAHAAASLDAELGVDVEEIARQALEALHRRPFRDRIAAAGSAVTVREP